MKNSSDIKTVKDNTDQKSRVLPIVLVGRVVVGGLAVGELQQLLRACSPISGRGFSLHIWALYHYVNFSCYSLR